jgi:hypothetical protein
LVKVRLSVAGLSSLHHTESRLKLLPQKKALQLMATPSFFLDAP